MTGRQRSHEFLPPLTTQAEFLPPPPTIAGPGARRELLEIVPRNGEIHVITDPGVRRAGIIDLVVDELPHDPIVHDRVSANPSQSDVRQLASDITGADFVLGIGGGSPMDATKAACVLSANEYAFDLVPTTSLADPERSIPFVLVPTTAGTGTETGHWAVISDPDRRVKQSLGHPHMRAKACILDPRLTTSLPPALTAITGFDAITHAVESLVANDASNLTHPYSERSYRIAAESIRTVMDANEEIDGRMHMLEASYLAGVAMNNAGLGMVHAISHAIGGRYDLAHGHLNALLLPSVVSRNGERSADVRARYAALVGQTSAPHEALADRIIALRRETGLEKIPEGTPDDPEWEIIAQRAVENVNAEASPVEFSQSGVIDLCRDVFERIPE